MEKAFKHPLYSGYIITSRNNTNTVDSSCLLCVVGRRGGNDPLNLHQFLIQILNFLHGYSKRVRASTQHRHQRTNCAYLKTYTSDTHISFLSYPSIYLLHHHYFLVILEFTFQMDHKIELVVLKNVYFDTRIALLT